MIFWAIVVAAGAGRRYGSPKFEVELGGKPLWQWSRDLFEDAGAAGVVFVGPVPGGIPGGETRRDSVAAGLAKVPEEATHVIVHDVARPLTTRQFIGRLTDRIEEGDADAVVPLAPIDDSLTLVSDGWMADTMDRDAVRAIQTPQLFVASVLRKAEDQLDGHESDTASLVMAAGGRVAVVEGDRSNMKITFPVDLAIAEAMIG